MKQIQCDDNYKLIDLLKFLCAYLVIGIQMWPLQAVSVGLYREDYNNFVSFFVCAESATLMAILFNYIRERKRCKQ